MIKIFCPQRSPQTYLGFRALAGRKLIFINTLTELYLVRMCYCLHKKKLFSLFDLDLYVTLSLGHLSIISTSDHNRRSGSSKQQLSKNVICIPKWEGGGGLCFFPHIHVVLRRQSYYIKSSHSSFEKN